MQMNVSSFSDQSESSKFVTPSVYQDILDSFLDQKSLPLHGFIINHIIVHLFYKIKFLSK